MSDPAERSYFRAMRTEALQAWMRELVQRTDDVDDVIEGIDDELRSRRAPDGRYVR